MTNTKAYTKTLAVNIDVDDSQLKKVDKDLKSLSLSNIFKGNDEVREQMKNIAMIQEKLKIANRGIDELESFGLKETDEYKELAKVQEELINLLKIARGEDVDMFETKKKEDFYDEKGNFDKEGWKQYKREKGKHDFIKMTKSLKANVLDKLKQLPSMLLSTLKNALMLAVDFIGGLFKEAFADIKKMQEADASGLYASKDIREENEAYGLTDAEGYGLRKALEKLGQSMADYQDGELNEKQYERINELAEVEKQRYEDVKESGMLDNIAEAKEKFNDLKEQLKGTIVKFITEHGDTIISVLSVIADVLGAIFGAIGAVINFFKVDDGISEAEAAKNVNNIIYGSTTSNSRVVNNNVNISNTMHAQNNNITSSQQLGVQGQKNQLQIMRALEV